ncbi:MAG: 50S ribosome-binding GTPase [Planctomycetota bacterium]|nr:50S ribosome-binding GTPase [Planctomycetota bacterium]
MSIFAAVMTGQGTGAISTIQLFGDKAEGVLKKVFKPSGSKPATFGLGQILLGTIHDGNRTIDQVTIGCEGRNNFTINCHGNPLIVEMIMKLLQKRNVKPITAQQLIVKILSSDKSLNTIAIETALAQAEAKTLEGAKIIANQVNAGLAKKAAQWFDSINDTPLKQIAADAKKILKTSETAKLIIEGLTAVIAGPPNTGKSTLLNDLAGKPKAIVTDIKGTTRDYVIAQCLIAPLCIELIDTAGLDDELAAAAANKIEKTAQKKSFAILEKADLVLVVLDNSQTQNAIGKKLLKKIADKKIITILNKCDLPAKFDTTELPKTLTDTIKISAKAGTGIENLLKKIRQLSDAADFDLQSPVCFTDRQKNLLQKLTSAKTKKLARQIISGLLNGRLCV